MAKVLLEVKDLVKYFPITKGKLITKQVGAVKAVDGISFNINSGETLGLVGESGCGKSTTGRLILRLIEATSGDVFFDKKSIFALHKREMYGLRKNMQIIFQDPYASLNPRMMVGDIISEPMVIHRIASGKSRDRKVQELLEIVGLASYHAKRYPREFSGGQRQRIGIARALSVDPRLIICDEPVSALDVSIQAQIINLLYDLQKELGLTYLFISHDLSVVKHISDKVAVMYLGKIVEFACKKELYNNPWHPYTEALLSAVPVPDPTKKKKRIILKGDIPSPITPPSGCRFHPRCDYAREICSEKTPELIDVGNNHYVACHFRKPIGNEEGIVY